MAKMSEVDQVGFWGTGHLKGQSLFSPLLQYNFLIPANCVGDTLCAPGNKGFTCFISFNLSSIPMR